MRVDFKRTPGRLSMLARGRSTGAGVGEVYVHGMANTAKVMHLARRGHDPLWLPDSVRRMAREMIRVGARSLDEQTMRRTLTAAAQYSAKFMRDRITSGQLGRLKSSTFWRKVWLIRHGRASSKYGVPGPYGFLTGRLVTSIKARWRQTRGTR